MRPHFSFEEHHSFDSKSHPCAMCTKIYTEGRNPTWLWLFYLSIFSLYVLWVIVTHCLCLYGFGSFREMHILLACYITCGFLTYVQKLHSRKYQKKKTYCLLKGNYLFLGSFFMKYIFLRAKILRLHFLFILFMKSTHPPIFVISLKHTFCHAFFTRCSKISTISCSLHDIWPFRKRLAKFLNLKPL